MSKRIFRLIMAVSVLVLLALGPLAAGAAASNGNADGLGRFIVVFDNGVNAAAKDVLTARFGGVVEEPIALIGNANVVLLPPQAAAALQRSGQVLRLEEDAVVTADKGKPTPTPTPPPPQVTPWGITQINAENVWGSDTGFGVKVAIVDTGIDRTHEDLIDNIQGGQNFVSIHGKIDPTAWNDDNGHGTHVSGIVAAENNSIGVVGVAPQAYLYGVKVLDKRGSGYVSAIINGIAWCIDNHIQVINMSLGTTSDVQSFHDACDAARAAGIVLVAAAGNSGDNNVATDDVEYPAKYGSVIAVAATDSSNAHPSWSSDGPEVAVSAPGVNVYSTYKGDSYATMSGTSMASPHTTGTVALMLAAGVAPSNVLNALETTALDLGDPGFDYFFGNGLINAEAATP